MEVRGYLGLLFQRARFITAASGSRNRGAKSISLLCFEIFLSWSREHLVWVKLLGGYVCNGCAMPRGQPFTALFPILQLWHSFPLPLPLCALSMMTIVGFDICAPSML